MNETSGRRRGYLWVGLAACTWGTWSLFIRFANVPTLVASPIVFVLLGLMALPFALRSKTVPRWDRTTWLLLIANSLSSAGNVVCYFGALSYTTVAIAVLTHYMAPVLIALVAPLIEGERVRGARVAALVASGGLVLILEPWRGNGSPLGAVLGCVSALFFVGTVLCSRQLGPRIGAGRIAAYHSLIAGILMLPLSIPGWSELSGHSLGLLAMGAALPGTVATILFLSGLNLIGSARAAVLTYLEPLVAVIVGWAVFAETLGPLAAAGAAMILASGVWVTRAGSQPA